MQPPLKASEVAEMFSVDPSTVNRWADEGKLPCFRTPGGHRRFRREDVDAFIAATEPAEQAS